MNIILSKYSGYCYGVKNAISIAEKSIKKYKKVKSLGNIIHNKRAIEKLEEIGLEVVDVIDKNYDNILFRSHGVEKRYYDFAIQNNINMIDTTCIFVKKIHKIVEENYKLNSKIIIVGNKNHPEVIGVNSFCDYTASFVESKEDIDNLNIDDFSKYIVVFQTTFNIQKYDDIVDKFIEKSNNIQIFNTICSATKKRQDFAINLSKKVDMMIVIGDKSSSNSRKLYDIVKDKCKAVFIEDYRQLEYDMFDNVNTVGLTAGASTPDFVIDEVIQCIKDIR